MKLKKEHLKTILLFLLVITSLVQIGIHWYQQVQGFPFHFVGKILNINDDDFPSMEVDSVRDRYFVPESILISVGPTSPLWKLEQKDPYYISIWNDIRNNYIPIMLKEKPTKTIPKEQWPDIISGRCIRIDFADDFPRDIIFWLEDKKPKDLKSFNSIKSIAIVPQTDVNETVNTLFVYDENQVYQYQIDIKEDFLRKAFYSKLADELSVKNKPLLYSLTANTTIFNSQEEILVALDRGTSKTYSALTVEIPSSIQLNRSNMESERIQDSILLNQKKSLMGKYNEPKGEILFTDTQNLYTLNADGVLEYRYLPMVDKEAGAASGAFSQALSFIELRRKLLGDAELALTMIEKQDYYYEMHFDYRIDGAAVYYSGPDAESRISAPLIIKANGDRVLECRWVIRSFHKAEESHRYSLYFINLVEQQIRAQYPELLENPPQTLSRLREGYVFSLKEQGDLTKKPHWIISTENKDYFIPLLEED